MFTHTKVRQVVAAVVAAIATAVAFPAAGIAGDGGGGPHPAVVQTDEPHRLGRGVPADRSGGDVPDTRM